MTPDEALEIMNFVADTWQNFEPGENTGAVWAMKLQHVDVRDARAAVMQLAGTDDWAPSIARVLNAARGIESSRSTIPALGVGMHPGGQRVLAAINAASAAVDRPAHYHKHQAVGCPCGMVLRREDFTTDERWRRVSHGAEHCPCCTTSAGRIEAFQSDVRLVLREAGVIE